MILQIFLFALGVSVLWFGAESFIKGGRIIAEDRDRLVIIAPLNKEAVRIILRKLEEVQ